LFARPSPVNRRVSIHDFTFGACSSFTRVTAYKVACPPKGGLLSRGFDPASCPTEPLGSYHVLPTTTWVDPPSTGDLRHWGALLTSGWPLSFGSPNVSAPRTFLRGFQTSRFRPEFFPSGATPFGRRLVR
jgi:hypothetical protein